MHTSRVWLLSLPSLLVASALSAGVDPALLAGLEARSLGPAGMSGRLAAIDAVETDPDVMVVGTATGGAWKSVNGGLNWEPIFDDQPVAAVGAVVLFQPNPDIVWIGTGEGSPRNSVSVGNGVYKSLDGGKSWSHMGLEKTERIHRIRLHPTDPDIAYVAALGQAWGENPERGVFKTTDGGRTWSRVLFVDQRTGAADLVMDSSNPNKLFAAMWQYRRWPWFFESGGPGSGLYVTYDAGASWKRFTEDDGLPKGELGRIGIDICRNHPEVVYALVEAEQSAMLRSADGGRSWQTMNNEPDVSNRPFYYADIRCDPDWPNRIYNLASRVQVSNDSGKTFEILGQSRSIHGDYQAMWINPASPEQILIGNDGGMALSRDRGETWYFVANLPLAQYYHIAVDLEIPYNVYGGLQDNGSWRGPSSIASRGGFRSAGGISSWHWVNVGGGDGFDTRPDPQNARAGYAMSQGGYLRRFNLETGEGKPIRPPQPGEEELRFNWSAALAIDPFDAGTIYYGSQFVHKSTDRGDSWSVISPDLTTNNPDWQKQDKSGGLTLDVTGAENFTTIVAIEPSPIQRGLLWVGTDDGRLHLTRDGGETWTDLEKRINGVPANTWIPFIKASTFEAGEAFVIFDDHRRSNWKPYVYRTADYGRSWSNLATEEIWGYALAIDQDPINRDLLFLGTEFGLYISSNGGKRWFKWTHGVPTVSVMDLVVHPRDHDLVLGTHGRAVYIIDDISPLRAIEELADKAFHLLAIAPAHQFESEPRREGYGLGSGVFQGDNRPYGALINVWLDDEELPHPDPELERDRREAKRREQASTAKTSPAGEGTTAPSAGDSPQGDEKKSKLMIEIADTTGTRLRKLEHEPTRGLNRIVWDLGRDAFERPQERGPFDSADSGPEVPPGRYAVTARYRDHEATAELEVRADPRSANTHADWQAREVFIAKVGGMFKVLTEAVERIERARADLETAVQLAEREKPEDEEAENPHQGLIDEAAKVIEGLDEKEKVLRRPANAKGILRRSEVLWEINYAAMSGLAYWSPPTPTDLAYLERAETRLRQALQEVNDFFAHEVAAVRSRMHESGITLLPESEPLGVSVGSIE